MKIIRRKVRNPLAEAFAGPLSMEDEIGCCKLEAVEELLQFMKREGISRSELAERMGVPPSRITKLLNGSENLTIATLVRAGRSVGAELKIGFRPAKPASQTRERTAKPSPASKVAEGPAASAKSGALAKEEGVCGMKRILIIAGPNGAGKTTFAQEFLPHEAGCPEFVNADLIAAGLSPFQPEKVAFAAGRLMLARIAELVTQGKSFAFETTLSARSWMRLIPRWQAVGYRVKLYFLRLPDSTFARRRVAARVRLGGHDVPPKTIDRRFTRGLRNLRNHYLALVDEWAIYDGSEAPARLLETFNTPSPETLMEDTAEYRPSRPTKPAVKPLDDPDFIGAEAALRRASAKAVARARAAGLEPVVRTPIEQPNSEE